MYVFIYVLFVLYYYTRHYTGLAVLSSPLRQAPDLPLYPANPISGSPDQLTAPSWFFFSTENEENNYHEK